MSAQMQQILGSFGPLILIMAVFYFFMIRPQKKKEKQIQEMRNNLKVGNEVITIGGIVGKIVLIKDDYIAIETSGEKSRIDITKWGISTVIQNKNDLKS